MAIFVTWQAFRYFSSIVVWPIMGILAKSRNPAVFLSKTSTVLGEKNKKHYPLFRYSRECCIFASRIETIKSMRRVVSVIIFSCLTLSLMAQNGIKVNYKGTKPTVTDFIWAAFPSLNYEDEEESGDRPWKALENAMERHRKGLPQEEGETLTIDTKNGYVLFESSGNGHIFRLEVCFWNESDGKHKLIAFNDLASTSDGKPCITEVSGFYFYRYDNATKRMTGCEPPGFEIDYNGLYELPRSGKDIIFTQWYNDGTTKRKVLKWNGRRFEEGR